MDITEILLICIKLFIILGASSVAIGILMSGYLVPIMKMKKRANGIIEFSDKKMIIVKIVLLFILLAILIAVTFLSSKFYYWAAIYAWLPSAIMQRSTVVRSEKELFINGSTIKIAKIERFIYSGYNLTIIVRNKRPVNTRITISDKNFLHDLVCATKAGYGQS